eukprot:CAMPEP_0185593324 /NCGR_PEP_ID=MMETSP0434-20130131/71119_1 /TAXON_ID=626734 ORGANISM="Favella taraikaensis, Strain Fe Narragansett Bay" /NCGR_SAMPLE_ID=MMETSP0434 /ASSEMBLY_ACC=CAM_ASM_000379 /LENGTH=63 /DNA_ID=CAMNT_0028219825 /DNA_START=284 /DNA_END=475 /DNA_ORIENTATION=+
MAGATQTLATPMARTLCPTTIVPMKSLALKKGQIPRFFPSLKRRFKKSKHTGKSLSASTKKTQ